MMTAAVVIGYAKLANAALQLRRAINIHAGLKKIT
jgi:hypothetical protein